MSGDTKENGTEIVQENARVLVGKGGTRGEGVGEEVGRDKRDKEEEGVG